jgi:enamine deaminase RidA (YjgF/YER057c/UK114 family)
MSRQCSVGTLLAPGRRTVAHTTRSTTMTDTFTNPDSLHDPTPFGYAHTARVRPGSEVVLVAGQYASDEHGGVAAAGFAEQVPVAFDRLAAALEAHGLGLGDVVQLRTYVVDLGLDALGPIGAAVQQRWGGRPPVNTLIGVAALAMPAIRFEVEAVAVRPATP